MGRLTWMAALGAGVVVLITPASAGAASASPRWEVANSALPLDRADEQVALSCLTPSWCMSVGEAVRTGQRGNQVWDGKKWSEAPGNFDFEVTDLSCHATRDCMVVGYHRDEVTD